MIIMMLRRLSCIQASALLSLITAVAGFTRDTSSSPRPFEGSLHVSVTTSPQGASNLPLSPPWSSSSYHRERPRRNNDDENNYNNDGNNGHRQYQRDNSSNTVSRIYSSSSTQQLRPPVVDSMLLRFVHAQKAQLTRAKKDQQQQQSHHHVWLHSAKARTSNATTALPYTSTVTRTTCVASTVATTETITATTTTVIETDNTHPLDEALAEAAAIELNAVNNAGTISSSIDSTTPTNPWLAQFDQNQVASLLLQLDPTLDERLANQAGESVQAEASARIARRSLRTFLKERDEQWYSTVNTVGRENVLDTDNHQFISSVSTATPLHTLEATLDVLLQSGLTASDIATIFTHSPGIALMLPTGSNGQGETLTQTLDRVWNLLTTTLPLRRYDARKIIRSTPGLLTLRGSKAATSVIELLQKLNVSTTSIAREKHALTTLLLRTPDALFRLVAFLSSDAVRMPLDSIGPLLRRSQSQELLDKVVPARRLSSTAVTNIDDNMLDTEDIANDNHNFYIPGLLNSVAIESALWKDSNQVRRDRVNELYKRMMKTAWTLRHKIGTADLGKVISAYPSVLLLDAETQILPNAKYLMEELGIFEDDLPKVLQLYPKLLGIPIDSMERVVSYLRDDLGVEEDNLPSIFRSFPALLTTEIKDMEDVVAFLRDKVGIGNVGRFVTRIPPILGYSVERELLPKWTFLQTVCMDTRLEVSKFPAVFSYPFERVLKTRYEYLQHKGRTPVYLFPLDEVVRHGDNEFATKVAKDEDGTTFAEFVRERLEKASPQRRSKGKAKKVVTMSS